jgi:phosphoglycolate phosphatase
LSSPVLLFDLDGTLTDPRQGIIGCLKYALQHLGRSCPPDEVLVSFIGPPLRGTFSVLLESADTALIEDALTLYRQRFADAGMYENRIYEGVPEMLERVRLMTTALFVATGKPAVYAERIVKYFGLASHFAGVYGPRLDGQLENKTDLLAHLLATERLPAAGAIMVGDRAADIIAAKVNGVHSIGVLWGYGSEAELRAAGADQLCLSPWELTSCLSQLAISTGAEERVDRGTRVLEGGLLADSARDIRAVELGDRAR